MKKYIYTLLITGSLSMIFLSPVPAQTRFDIKTDQPLYSIQPTMWGIFFEDINFAADGGLYAELVKNRSFEFANPLMGWRQQNSSRYAIATNAGNLQVLNPGNTNRSRIARVTVQSDKGYGLSNEGFRGMGIKKDARYNFSIMARLLQGNTMLRIELADSAGKILGSTVVKPESKQWKTYTASITATATEAKAKLNIWFDNKGLLEIDRVSVFPVDTWKNRPGGMRKDLVQLLADMKPGFVRFPGGCIVEGRDLSTRYQWKKTIGDIDTRELIINRWNTEFNHRLAPDYFQTFGLGFFEYFQLAEDIGAEPLPILNCGMACQFNTMELVPMEQLAPYIQDALDLIEFANGSVDTRWGKTRKAMGHPAPFNLKYIGVGNEQWGPQYIERYKAFSAAIKAKYPHIKIVSGSGPSPSGELFDYGSKELKTLNAELVDEHYYSSPEWFFKNAARYDNYDRGGPKIFAGEYAAHVSRTGNENNKNNWLSALAEAAFMTGLERNADIVQMASYAPLLAHKDAWQWKPDLIWFDNLSSFGTPNYYVQKLFSLNKGTDVLPITAQGEKPTGQNGLYASAVADKNTKSIIVKLVNTNETPGEVVLQFNGSQLSSTGSITILQGKDNEENSFEQPVLIQPKEQVISINGQQAKLTLGPRSFSIVRITKQ